MKLSAPPAGTQPLDIKLHQRSRVLEISFDNGDSFSLPCEYLRVFTQSAEAVGHAEGQEILQVGKEQVNISSIKPVGQYGIAPTFTDGHNSGIYTWDLLYYLGKNYDTLWAAYLAALQQAGHHRQDITHN